MKGASVRLRVERCSLRVTHGGSQSSSAFYGMESGIPGSLPTLSVAGFGGSKPGGPMSARPKRCGGVTLSGRKGQTSAVTS